MLTLIECAKLRASRVFVPYVPYVPTYLTCLRDLSAWVSSCLCFLHTFFLLRAFIFLRALHAFIFYVPYTSSFFLRALRTFIFLCALRVFIFLRVLSALIFLRALFPFHSFIKCGATYNQPQQAEISNNEVE